MKVALSKINHNTRDPIIIIRMLPVSSIVFGFLTSEFWIVGVVVTLILK